MVACEDTRLAGSFGESLLSPEPDKPLEIFIPFTTVAHTQRSIEHAQWLCTGMNVRLRVLCVRPVPYPLDLDRPDVCEQAVRKDLNALVSEVPITAEIWYCRDRIAGFLNALGNSRLVILTLRRGLFPTSEERLGRALKRAGHRVSLFMEDNLRV